jgi:PAS domain S-box-containing protein
VTDQRFKNILEAVRDYAIYMLSPEGIILTWSPGAENIKGYKSEEIIGKNFSIFYTKEDIEARKPEIELAQAKSSGRIEDESWKIKKDGTIFWANTIISAIYGDNGILEGFVKVTRDLTQRRKLEEELKRSNGELEHFAYIASHDLKAPLRAIINLAQWIKEDLRDNISEATKKHILLLTERIKRMNNLIEGILQYSRIGRIYVVEELVDVNEVIEEVLLALDKKKFDIEVGPMPSIKANRITLVQLFQNLIGNAIKHHNRDDGHIEINVKETSAFYEFSVKDDGPGIDLIFHKKLFVLFQVINPKSDSTGIGLALCKKIVERAGGSIWLEPNGQGCTFIFTWPKPLVPTEST